MYRSVSSDFIDIQTWYLKTAHGYISAKDFVRMLSFRFILEGYLNTNVKPIRLNSSESSLQKEIDDVKKTKNLSNRW